MKTKLPYNTGLIEISTKTINDRIYLPIATIGILLIIISRIPPHETIDAVGLGMGIFVIFISIILKQTTEDI